jgi:hypothetical protein
MKKIFLVSMLVGIIVLSLGTTLQAVETKNISETETTSEIIETKNKVQSDIDKFVKKYGSESYGTTAYILNGIRVYSIPLCFIGIAIGALYQYVLGTRRLDMKQKGFALIVAFITILVICQVLPLIFAIVVKGWRG